VECSEKILIVDDDPDLILSFEGLMGSICGEDSVVTARDGAEALEMLRSGLRPCRIITDLRMPRMNGEEFINALRSGGFGDIPVITMTGAVDGSPVTLGSAVHLKKPFTNMRLESALIATAGPRCRAWRRP
jgi:CheY-like chemotaxis protein